MREYMLYGLRQGQTERYMEELLIATKEQETIDYVKDLATQEGFHSFRVATWNGEAPNFTNTLNI